MHIFRVWLKCLKKQAWNLNNQSCCLMKVRYACFLSITLTWTVCLSSSAVSVSSSCSQANDSHNYLISFLSSAACFAPMEAKCPSLYSLADACLILFEQHVLLYRLLTYTCIYLMFFLSPLLYLPLLCFHRHLSLSLSLYLLSFCVAQSLLVPGKSPSKYGRRGSAIGIGTVEEVHVYFFCFFLPLLFHCLMPAHLSLFEHIQQAVYSVMPFVIFMLYSVNEWQQITAILQRKCPKLTIKSSTCE